MEGFIKTRYGRGENMSDIQYDNEKGSNPVSITPSGYFGNSPDKIIKIDNFLTETELDIIGNFARNLKEWDVTRSHYNEDGTIIYEADYWKDRVATLHTLEKQDPMIPNYIKRAIARLKIVIEDTYDVTVSSTNPTIVRWLPGQLQNPHADKELHEGENAGKPNDFPWYDVGALFYLNDDYEGGELYFPNQGVEFKPTAGSAFFFPGDMNYIHGVREIKSGIRYTSPMFWTIRSHQKPKRD